MKNKNKDRIEELKEMYEEWHKIPFEKLEELGIRYGNQDQLEKDFKDLIRKREILHKVYGKHYGKYKYHHQEMEEALKEAIDKSFEEKDIERFEKMIDELSKKFDEEIESFSECKGKEIFLGKIKQKLKEKEE